MTRWRPYPEYKDAGVPWLGEIPLEWRTTQVKYSYEVRLGKMLASEPSSSLDTLEPYLRAANVYWEGVDTSDIHEMWFSPSEKAQYRLEPGDLVVCEGGDVGRSAIWKGELPECYIQNAVHRVRGKDGYSNRFFYYWLFALKSAGYIDLICSKATIAHLTAEKLATISIVVPPPKEQRVIAAFLDRQTAKIDALIAEQRHLIELLQERRAALISHAVTKGLDPEAPMKDSHISWLGEIPRNWEVVRLKFIAHVQSGVAKGRNLEGKQTVDLPYLRVANVQSGFVDLSDVATITIGKDEIERYSLKPGDILMTEGGDYDKLGRGTVWEGQIHPCVHQNHIFAVRALPGTNPYWISTLTQVDYARHYFILRSKQSTNLASISMTNVMELPIILPPTPEQDRILSYLDRETAKIDALIAEIETGIAHLEEYRTALISAAVTGKIDVRDALPFNAPTQPRLTGP
jgi:type I restriction enzyme S subunit